MKVCPRCGAQNPDNSAFCANCALPLNQSNETASKKKGVSASIGVLIAVGAMFFMCIVITIVVGIISPKQPETAKASPTPAATPASQVIASNSEVSKNTNSSAKSLVTATPELPELVKVKSTWMHGGFGAIAIWKVTIKNNSNKKLGDIKFRTAYYSETGNKVGSGGTDSLLGKDTIEKIVPPKSTRTFEVNDGFVNSEAETANFEIVSWREIP